MRCFVEAAGGSINLASYLAIDMLGENGDDTAAVGAPHSWIVERGVPLSIPRVEEKMGMELGIVWQTASLCGRWRWSEIVMVPVGEAVTRLAIALQGQAKKIYTASLAGSVAPGGVEWVEWFEVLKGKIAAVVLSRITFSDMPLVERLVLLERR